MIELEAFGDEVLSLTKQARGVVRRAGRLVARGVVRRAGRLVAKHPLQTLGVAATVLPAAVAGAAGYKRGKRMGRPARYLKASRYGPTRAFWTNYSRLLTRKKMSKRQRQRLSEHYREKAMKR